MSFSDILRCKAAEANTRFGLFSENERVLVGFSGGADSLALLCVMHGLLGENVHAFHVNHMLRGSEADADERFCENFCKERGISFSSVKLDVLKASGGSAVEETARNMRYEAFAKECIRIGAGKIALAHTASDNAETVIFNISRGTGLAGLRGIPPTRAHGNLTVIRPLILCKRSEIEGFAEENGLPYRTDATNSDVHYRRNYIRHKIIPLMKELNPALEERMSMMSVSLRDDEDFISGEAKAFIDKNLSKNGISAESLLSAHRAVRARVYNILHSQESAEHLEEKHVSDIESLVSCGRNGARIILPGKVAAVLKNGRLYFVKEESYAEENAKNVFSEKLSYGIYRYGDKFAVLIAEKGKGREEADALSDGASFVSSILLSEKTLSDICVRNRENGDKYFFGGMTRILKKILSGNTEKAKKIRPVFCDGKGIFWFPGFRIRDDVYNDKEEKRYVLHYIEY